jgi:hypothetical protein
MAPGAQLLTRLDDRTFLLRAPRSGLFASIFAPILRPRDRGLAQGEVTRVGGLEITVAERGEFGPSVLRVRADVPLEDASLRFLVATPFGYARYTLPPVGETYAVPPAADPMSPN